MCGLDLERTEKIMRELSSAPEGHLYEILVLAVAERRGE
jgi:hypothetical protein